MVSLSLLLVNVDFCIPREEEEEEEDVKVGGHRVVETARAVTAVADALPSTVIDHLETEKGREID